MVNFTDNIANASKGIFDTKEPLDYVVCSFSDKATMDVHQSGTGGYADVKSILESEFGDKVAMGAFAVTALDERGSVISVRKKIIHFIWTGPDCGIMQKSKGATSSGAFREAFPGCALYVQIKDPEDLNEASLESKLRAAGGAHQPKEFDWTNKPVEGFN
mmetsp:Transcript_10386/g.11922  ORF Transcript_10386/g.11922 Transcript_10386/m.11922 type:complete len:160 (+) Transcript_10386:197-676(+)|eukprot:CAMPEP_0184020350 /NCGR_PEP_ID=MMETSP0954-20121128/9300_1 /TAXON_ID=627963 /ORGANISM="Aplanochytrium sp, Strain PBS07" /LENGTH=159 /DNA_ID=CAMNT_0026302201 /DNA_START=143 /DNA_END=622 /DNA_ORIENTATION=-